MEELDGLIDRAEGAHILEQAQWTRDRIIPAMSALRETVDAMEEDVSSQVWPYPTYGDLMFRV